MKIKKLLACVAMVSLFALFATGCGAKSDKPTDTKPTQTQVTPDTSEKDTTQQEDSDEVKLAKYKASAISKLDELVNPVIAKIENNDLKTAIQEYYDTEKQYVNGINDLETAKEAVNKVISDTAAFAVNTLKPIVIEKINAIINPLIQNISYTSLKTSVQAFYDEEIEKIDDLEDLNDAADLFKEIVDDTKKFIKDETEKVIIALKNAALEELDPYVTALIAKIPYNTLKTDVEEFYEEEKTKLEDVDIIEGINLCVAEIKDDLEAFALTEIKKIAISELDDLIEVGLDKIPFSSLKADLREFKDTELAKLNDVTKVEDVPTTLETVLEETAAYIKQLLASVVKEYIYQLTRIESATAYDYLPEAMSPTYSGNRVTADSIAYDFTSFTNVSAINQAGFGEQWQMVVENINQTIAMAKVFNVAQTVLTSAGEVVDTYLSNSYADDMEYEFSGSGYTGLFTYKDGLLKFYITMTSSVNVPIAGSVKPVIKMEYDLTKEAKGMFISLGDAYKIKYVIARDSYEMATTYGLTALGHSGSRSSYLSISKIDGRTTGHIYEYTTLDGEDRVQACADFYIESGYVSVIGNKASGMKFFEGFVSELYLANTGRLLGYEVKEQKTILGVTATYNTFWFNLWDIENINTIKVLEKSDDNPSSRSTVDVYLNGSTSLFSPTYNKKGVGIASVKTSRKYDIEYRSRFYYTYDSENDKYIANEVLVPMMFIQDSENFDKFEDDISADNGINASVASKMSSVYLAKIIYDYGTYIPLFEENKDNVNSDTIIAYLNQYE